MDRAILEELRTETLNHVIINMSPRPVFNHNIVAGNIYNIFSTYLESSTCTAIPDGTEVYLSDKDRFIPDMSVVCNTKIIKRNGVHGAPDFVVEVLSPSTEKRDKGYKKSAYEAAGVKEYWLVDVDKRTIEVYELVDGRYELVNLYGVFPTYSEEEKTPDIKTKFQSLIFPDLTIDLDKVFAKMIAY